MEENIMYTIVDRWVAILDGKIYEPKVNIIGLYKTIDKAIEELNNYMMKSPDKQCVVTKINDRKYTFLSPDEKTIGYTEIREIIC